MKKLLVALLLTGVSTTPLAADIIQQILVKVNGEIFTKTDLEEQQVRALRDRDLQFDPVDLQNDETLRQALLEVTPLVLSLAIDELLLVQRGRELGYEMTDEQFQQILDGIKEENGIETDAEFQAALDREGLTLETFRSQIERQLLINRVQQIEVMPKLSITEEEVRSYYEGHPDEFTSPATVTLREIFISVEGSQPGTVNVAAEEAARATIDVIRSRLLAGEDFVALVAEVSDAASSANGGLIGPLNRDDINPSFLPTLDAMAPGDISEPVRTAQGYQLLKLESRTATHLRSFDEARDLIADKVGAEKQRAEFDKYLERLRAQAIIEWKNEDLKKLYDEYMLGATAGSSH